ncbi:hypothetical protein V7161_22020 [Neobacillus drentensis]
MELNLEAKKIIKVFDTRRNSFHALHEIDLRVAQGEFVGVSIYNL